MAEKARRVKLPLWKKLSFSALVAGALLVCLELGMRLVGYGREPSGSAAPSVAGEVPPLGAWQYFWVSDPHLGFRNRPDGTYHTWYIEGKPLCTTDQFGYRNGFGWPGEGESPIVLFVGDSTTFCLEVDDQQTGPSEVAKLLSGEHDVRVLNAGVRGYSTLQAKRMLAQCFQRFPRIRVAVYTYCGNDVEENMVPNVHYPGKGPLMIRNRQSGEFEEVEVSEPAVRWGQSFEQWRIEPPVLSGRAKAAAWLEARSVLMHGCLEGWRRIDFVRLGTPEFPDGTKILSAADAENWHKWAVRNGGHAIVRRLLGEMNDICRSRGAVLLVTSYHGGHPDDSTPELAASCKAIGVEFVGLEQEFTGDPLSYASLCVDGQYDEHYGPRGTRAYARALAPAIRRILRSQAAGAKGGGS